MTTDVLGQGIAPLFGIDAILIFYDHLNFTITRYQENKQEIQQDVTSTSEKFTVKFVKINDECLCQVSRKSDFFTFREQEITMTVNNERTNKPTNTADHNSFWCRSLLSQ